MSIDEQLRDIGKLCQYRLYNLADKKVNILYEKWTRDEVEMNDIQLEWMFNLIDRISTAIYC